MRQYGTSSSSSRYGNAACLYLPKPRISEQAFARAGVRAGLAPLLGLVEPPTPVMCGKDPLAVGARLEVEQRGLSEPEDLPVSQLTRSSLASRIHGRRRRR